MLAGDEVQRTLPDCIRYSISTPLLERNTPHAFGLGSLLAVARATAVQFLEADDSCDDCLAGAASTSRSLYSFIELFKQMQNSEKEI